MEAAPQLLLLAPHLGQLQGPHLSQHQVMQGQVLLADGAAMAARLLRLCLCRCLCWLLVAWYLRTEEQFMSSFPRWKLLSAHCKLLWVVYWRSLAAGIRHCPSTQRSWISAQSSSAPHLRDHQAVLAHTRQYHLSLMVQLEGFGKQVHESTNLNLSRGYVGC